MPPITTGDQNYILQHSTATGLEPQVLQHAPASPVFDESDTESVTEDSEPRFQLRHFPDSSESGDEVRVIEHYPASLAATASTSALTGTAYARPDQIGQQIKTALLGEDRDGLRRLFKASPDLVNAHLPEQNSPPLLIAVRIGQRDIVEALLAVPGIHVDARDSEHRNAVHAACEAGNLALVRLLVAHGANLHTHCKKSTPLIAACISFNPEVLGYVLKKTPRQLIDFRAPGGNTALVNSVVFGNIKAVGKLIARGADVAWLTPSRQSALSKAIEKRRSRDLILSLLSAMPLKVVLDKHLALRLVRRAKRRQDYRILNELATRKFEDRYGHPFELRGVL